MFFKCVIYPLLGTILSDYDLWNAWNEVYGDTTPLPTKSRDIGHRIHKDDLLIRVPKWGCTTWKWQILKGVDENASDEEIKRAYHNLALQYHPDLPKNADHVKESAAMMAKINEAYEKIRNWKFEIINEQTDLIW